MSYEPACQGALDKQTAKISPQEQFLETYKHKYVKYFTQIQQWIKTVKTEVKK